MTLLLLTFLLLGIGATVGLIGALIGIGGGMMMTPILVLGLGVDIHYAIGATLCSVIGSSIGATISHLHQGSINLRAGFFFALATTSGAILGALISLHTHQAILTMLFGVVLIMMAGLSLLNLEQPSLSIEKASPLAHWLHLNGKENHPQEDTAYGVTHILPGLIAMEADGFLSGMLGIGSGAFKVMILERILGFPLKISIATSSFMIGMTATASASIYLKKGYIDPVLTAPITIGIIIGALLGARLLPLISTKILQPLFYLIITFSGIKMIFQGWHTL